MPTYYKCSWTYWKVESQVQVFIFWNFHYKQNFFGLFVINVFVWIWWYRPLSFCNVSHTGFGYLERKPSDCCKFGKSYFVSLIGRMIENLLMWSRIVTCFIIYFLQCTCISLVKMKRYANQLDICLMFRKRRMLSKLTN